MTYPKLRIAADGSNRVEVLVPGSKRYAKGYLPSPFINDKENKALSELFVRAPALERAADALREGRALVKAVDFLRVLQKASKDAAHQVMIGQCIKRLERALKALGEER